MSEWGEFVNPRISELCVNGNHESDSTTSNTCMDFKCRCKCHRKAAPILTRQDIENAQNGMYYDE